MNTEAPYTHFAPAPVTDAPGTVIDIDGEQFVIGASTATHVGTDTFGWPLEKYDYTKAA